jgi:hypothetical protein
MMRCDWFVGADRARADTGLSSRDRAGTLLHSLNEEVRVRSEREGRDLVQWLEARNVLLGRNNKRQDVVEGLRLARACDHHDAKYVAGLFGSATPATPLEAQQVFCAQGDDARALAFAALVGPAVNADQLRRAADLGSALAQAELAALSDAADRLELARRAAGQGEPKAMTLVASMLFLGGAADTSEAVGLWREAALLGDATAQYYYAVRAYDLQDARRYQWLGLAASNGDRAAPLSIVYDTVGQLRRHDARAAGAGRVVFEIGRVLRGHVGRSGAVVFGVPVANGEHREAAARAVALHRAWEKSAREALQMWTRVGRRCGVVRDVRRLVAQLVWAERHVWSE